MRTVNEVSKLSGVSRRALQYYDEIGLLPPSTVKESGYRQYDDESLRRLWGILFYKELGVSLDDIRLLLDKPKKMEKEIMRQHKQILLAKQSQLQKMALSVDRLLNDEFDISMLRDFERNKIVAVKKMYARELQALMESGFFLPVAKKATALLTAFNTTSLVERASILINIDFGMIFVLGCEASEKFQKAMKDGPKSLAAKDAVAAFKEFVNIFPQFDDAAFRTIAQA
jgi:DNA-binding transcriptional MerR regulator